MKKVPNERKLIYAIYTFIVASWCLLFSYGSHLNTTTNLNGIFFGDVHLAPIKIVILLENQNYNYFNISLSIAVLYLTSIPVNL